MSSPIGTQTPKKERSMEKTIKNLASKLIDYEVVLDAVISVLVDKGVISRGEIQSKIVDQASAKE